MTQETLVLSEPIIVAPIGRAGVGKSTFVAALAERFQQLARLSIVSPSSAKLSVPRYAFTSWRRSFDAMMHVRHDISPNMHNGLRDYVRFFQKLVITERVIRQEQAGRNDVVVIDEFGVFHTALWAALRASETSTLTLESLFNCDWFKQNIPDVLILCDLDEKTTLERRRSRSNRSDNRFLQSGEYRARVDSNYKVFRSQITRLLDSMDNSEGMVCLTLDMNNPVDDNVQLAKEIICERLSLEKMHSLT